MSEVWISVKPVVGGQVVVCRLCGKRFSRTYKAADSNYAQALSHAEEYARLHNESAQHVAALTAFHADDEKALADLEGERLLADTFGDEFSELAARRRWAKEAARKTRD